MLSAPISAKPFYTDGFSTLTRNGKDSLFLSIEYTQHTRTEYFIQMYHVLQFSPVQLYRKGKVDVAG